MRLRRWGLTASFAAVSLLAIASVGAVLVVAIASQVRQYALAEATRTAEAYVGAGVMDVAPPDQLTGRAALDDQARSDLDALVAAPGDSLLALRLWGPGSQLVFGTDSRNGRFPDGLRLDAALTGRPAPKVVSLLGVDGRVRARVLSVYLPIRNARGVPVGAAEVLLDYKATDAAVASAIRLVALLVVAGLALLWLLLFRTVRNASRRLRSHATENARLALLDPLTGLPNRRLLSERIDRAVAEARRADSAMALLLLDVDGFKEINDTLGHDVGDKLLIEVARRVRAVARERDTVARLGGDEFAVLMPVVKDGEEASQAARRVLGVFEQSFVVDGIALHVDTSIGVALLPDHAGDQTTLLRRADVAMYAAKRAKLGMTVYSPDGDHHTARRLTLMADLRKALDTDEQLALYYQPKVDLRSGRVAGLEALLRWEHPTLGFVSPGDFVPLAEQTGLVSDLTGWVLGEAVGQLYRWEQERAPVPLDLAVNLSARNLHEVELPRRVRQLLHDARVSPATLELEITESAIPADPERALDALEQLAELGVRLAVDDFGIGNTSISQLRRFPLRSLKIDRSFIAPLATDPGATVLVRAIVELAHEFGLVTVAEGVEDRQTAVILGTLGCDLAQGFWWSPAVPAVRVADVVAAIESDAGTPVTSGSRRRGRAPRPA